MLSLETNVSFNRACPAFNVATRRDGVPLACLKGSSIGIWHLLTSAQRTPLFWCIRVWLGKNFPMSHDTGEIRRGSGGDQESLESIWTIGEISLEVTGSVNIEASCNLRYNPSIPKSSNKILDIDLSLPEQLAEWRTSFRRN